MIDDVDLEARVESHTELEDGEALDRLVVVRELREETSRLGSRHLGSSRDITVPASWLSLLVRQLEEVIADEAAPDDAGEELAVDVEQLQALIDVIRDAPAGSSCSFSPIHHEALLFGLYDALRWKQWLGLCVGDHNDPPGLRFVIRAELVALYEFTMAVEDITVGTTTRSGGCQPHEEEPPATPTLHTSH